MHKHTIAKRPPQLPCYITLENVTLKYKDSRPVFNRFNLSLLKYDKRPQRYALIGESGSGKTSIVNLILGNLVPQKGRIRFNGVPLVYSEEFLLNHRASIGFVSQNLRGMISYLNVFDNVKRPATLKGISDVEATKYTQDALKSVGLTTQLWYKTPDRLSGGELQRALVARMIVHNPYFMICDEPTSALDRPNSRRVVEAIMNANIPTLIVTHDPMLFAPYMDRLFLLMNGRPLDITCLKNNPILGTFDSSKDLYKEWERVICSQTESTYRSPKLVASASCDVRNMIESVVY